MALMKREYKLVIIMYEYVYKFLSIMAIALVIFAKRSSLLLPLLKITRSELQLALLKIGSFNALCDGLLATSFTVLKCRVVRYTGSWGTYDEFAWIEVYILKLYWVVDT